MENLENRSTDEVNTTEVKKSGGVRKTASSVVLAAGTVGAVALIACGAIIAHNLYRTINAMDKMEGVEYLFTDFPQELSGGALTEADEFIYKQIKPAIERDKGSEYSYTAFLEEMESYLDKKEREIGRKYDRLDFIGEMEESRQQSVNAGKEFDVSKYLSEIGFR